MNLLCIPRLGLTARDRSVIQSEEELDDRQMDAVSQLLRRAFSENAWVGKRAAGTGFVLVVYSSF